MSVRRRGSPLPEERLELQPSPSPTARKRASGLSKSSRELMLLYPGRRMLGSTIASWQERNPPSQPPAGGTSPFFFLAAASLTSSLSRLLVSKEPGAPGQPRVQDLRLEQPGKVGETPGSGWQAVVTWDPGETPVGRTFTLQYCR